jgi:quinol monooxygenase YgiN
MSVRIVLKVKVKTENMNSLREVAIESQTIAREKEAGGTLALDMFSMNDSSGRCLFIEHYADQSAYMRHIEHIGDRGRRIMELMEIEEMLVTGRLDAAFVGQLKDIIGGAFSYYPDERCRL